MSGGGTDLFLGGCDAAKPIKSLTHGAKTTIINTHFVNVKTFCSNFNFCGNFYRRLCLYVFRDYWFIEKAGKETSGTI